MMVVDVAQHAGDLMHALPMLPLRHNRGCSPNVQCSAPSSGGWLTIRIYDCTYHARFLGAVMSMGVHKRPSGLWESFSALFSVRKQQMPSLCAHMFHAPISQQCRVAVRCSSSLLCIGGALSHSPSLRRDHGGICARRLQTERSQEGSPR